MSTLEEVIRLATAAGPDRLTAAAAALRGERASSMVNWKSKAEIAEALGVTTRTIERWRFPVASTIGGLNRYDLEECERFLRDRQQMTGGPRRGPKKQQRKAA